MPLSQGVIDAVVAKAAASDLAKNRWRDRGVAPIGYVKGMAVCFANAYAKLLARDPSALAMVAYVEGKRDIFDHYEQEFKAVGMSTDAPAADRLRYLFVALTGLGMRESSGRYCEGRDKSASNTTADTAEAGLFQQSWDSRSANPEIVRLFGAYKANASGFLSIFKEGVTPKPGDLDNYGTGEGRDFQALIKSCPAFAVEAAAIGLRTLYTHWGPIVRKEAELAPSAEYLFRQVQAIVDGAPKPAGKSWWQALLDLFKKTPAQPKPLAGAPWVPIIRGDTGLKETRDGAVILSWRPIIAKAFPETTNYVFEYTSPTGQPWCGFGLGAAFARCPTPIRPPFGPTDTDRFMWADSWSRNWGQKLTGPIPGCIGVRTRNGGGHVTMVEKVQGKRIWCRGYNQSDSCNVSEYALDDKWTGFYWPPGFPIVAVEPNISNAVAAGKES